MAKSRKVFGGESESGAKSPVYHVFMSHATSDKFIANALCEKIESFGLRTFRDDRDIAAGGDIAEEIVSAMRRSGEVAVLLTPASVNRFWVAMEIGMAIYARRRVVPIFYHVRPDEAPDVLHRRRGYHLHEIEAYWEDLRSRYPGGAE